MRGFVRWVLTAAVAVLVLVPVSAHAEDSPENQLAALYAPLVRLVKQEKPCGPGEPFRPVSVDQMFANPSIALRGPWTQHDLVKVAPTAQDVSRGLRGYALDLPPDPLQPECAYESWANATWGAEGPAVVYARVATQSGKSGRLALQYYFFYAFNDYNNKHEADWERIQLEFPADTAAQALAVKPVKVVYSQHYGAEYAAWDDPKLERANDTHPVVYVSAGSHANQFSAGVFMGNSANLGFGCDSTAGEHESLVPKVETIPSDQAAAVKQFPWLGYEGHWGEVGPARFYEGPTGPNRKTSWRKPFAWADGARPASFEVPGSELVGSRATETYCAAAGRGSDLFRAYVHQPLVVLGLLAAAIVAVGWLLRRTSWDGPMLPLERERSAGQVTTASWRLLLHHLLLFLQISGPMIAIAVVSALIQSLTFLAGLTAWWTAVSTGLLLASLLFSAAATIRAAVDLDAGRPATARSAYAGSWRQAIAAAPALAVAGVIAVLGFGSLILSPVVLVLLAGWTLLLPMVIIDGAGPFGALTKSLALARRTWRTVLPVALLAVVVITSTGALLAALLFVVYPAPFVILNSLPPLVFASLWPLIGLASTYAYANARVSTA